MNSTQRTSSSQPLEMSTSSQAQGPFSAMPWAAKAKGDGLGALQESFVIREVISEIVHVQAYRMDYGQVCDVESRSASRYTKASRLKLGFPPLSLSINSLTTLSPPS